VRLRPHELLDGLTGPLVVQGARVWDGLAAAAADPARRRLLLTPLRSGALDGVEPGPAEVAAGSPEGLVRMPAEIVEVDPHGVTAVVDPLLAEFEGRRRHWRLGLQLPVRGQPADGGPPWTATTLDVSAGGALIDRPLPPDTAHRIVLSVGGTDLRIGAAIARPSPPGATALSFTALSDAAARALAVALLRASARSAA
jgi:hypothetical protein